ncbi:MAG: hypothetical protein AAF443_08785 [Chlamydiota bacterium]
MVRGFVAAVFVLVSSQIKSENCPDCPSLRVCDAPGCSNSYHKTLPKEKHFLEHVEMHGVGWTCRGINIEKKRCVWAEFHCDQIRQLRVRVKDLETALEQQKQYLIGCDTALEDKVSDNEQNLWDEINIKGQKISELERENLTLKNRLKAVEERVGLFDENCD